MYKKGHLTKDSKFKKFDKETEARFKEEIKSLLSNKKVKSSYRKNMDSWGWILLLVGSIFSAFLFLVFMISTNFGLSFFSLVLGIGLSIWLLMEIIQKGIWRKNRDNNNIESDIHSKMYKKYFELYYDNVKADSIIPSDALIRGKSSLKGGDAFLGNFSSVKFYLDNLIVVPVVTQYKTWDKANNRNPKFDFTNAKMLISIYNMPNNLKDLKMKMVKYRGITDKTQNLENKAFNRVWNYKYNDPIKFRVLLTPYAQERLSSKRNIFTQYKDIKINKVAENRIDIRYTLYKWSDSHKDTIFSLNKVTKHNRKINFNLEGEKYKNNIVDIILQDFYEDLNYILKLLKSVSAFQSIT